MVEILIMSFQNEWKIILFSGSKNFHVFELTRQLPRFSMYCRGDSKASYFFTQIWWPFPVSALTKYHKYQITIYAKTPCKLSCGTWEPNRQNTVLLETGFFFLLFQKCLSIYTGYSYIASTYQFVSRRFRTCHLAGPGWKGTNEIPTGLRTTTGICSLNSPLSKLTLWLKTQRFIWSRFVSGQPE